MIIKDKKAENTRKRPTEKHMKATDNKSNTNARKKQKKKELKKQTNSTRTVKAKGHTLSFTASIENHLHVKRNYLKKSAVDGTGPQPKQYTEVSLPRHH